MLENSLQAVKKRLPITDWLPVYNKEALSKDLLAGFTIGLMVIPQSIAFAFIAGLPPQYGLYSSFAPCFAYIFLGTIKEITIGPTTLMALICQPYTSLNTSYAPLLSLVNGIGIFACGILNLGCLVDFFSMPVISGFSTAASFTIISKQIPNLIGINTTLAAAPHWPGLTPTYVELALNWPTIKWTDSTLGLSCIFILLAVKKLPQLNQWKTSNIAWYLSTSRNALVVVLAMLLAHGLNLNGEDQPFILTGEIEPGLPQLSLPMYGLNENPLSILIDLGSLSITLPLITILGHVAIAKSLSQTVDASQELLALGLSNFLGSFVSGFPVTASFGRTAINKASGVQTPLAGAVTGVMVLSALVYLMPLCAYIPRATLAAVIISAVVFNLDFEMLPKLWKFNGWDVAPWLLTFWSCVLWRLEYGIVVGVLANVCQLFYLSRKPQVTFSRKGDHELFIYFKSGLTYASVNTFRNQLESQIHDHHITVCTFDCFNLAASDFTSASILQDIIIRLDKQGILVKPLHFQSRLMHCQSIVNDT